MRLVLLFGWIRPDWKNPVGSLAEPPRKPRGSPSVRECTLDGTRVGGWGKRDEIPPMVWRGDWPVDSADRTH